MKTQSSILRRGSERGMSLIEVMVAVLVFTVVFLAALGLYQAANRAYLATDAATIQQQNARYAVDRVAETLRDAGANYNGMGWTKVADEQIEGAWESAIFVRGDFNSRRETARQSTTFPMVTTDNSDVVGYVLRKPGANSVNIDVKLDLTPTQRDAIKTSGSITNEETRTIEVAASNLAGQTNPPYQLTRVTFDDAGDPVYQVIADNVFRLSFIYRNASGTETIVDGTSDGGDDTDRAARAAVRRIGLNVVTMGDRADFNYKDPSAWTTDAFSHTAPAQGVATRNRRKFDLSEEIVAINLGRKGARHNTAPKVDIAAPAWIKVCTGHCKSFLIQWAATTTPGIVTYDLRIQASSPFIDRHIPVPATQYYFTQVDPTIQTYTFSVAGQTTTGIVGTYSPTVPKTATHEAVSIPSSPTNVQGAQAAGANAMSVTWNPVQFNTGTITASTCTQAGTSPGVSAPPANWNREAVDLAYHEVYRGLIASASEGTPATYSGGVANGNFTPGVGNRVDDDTLGDLTNTRPDSSNSFTDNTAAPCGRYFYRVKAYDGCDVCETGNGSTAMTNPASFIPAAGVTPAVPPVPTPAAPPVAVSGNYNLTFNWPPVVRDSTGAKAATAHYRIMREQKVGSGTWTAMTPLNVWEATTVTDTVPSMVGTDPAIYRYAVKAIYQCGAVGNTDREAQGDWYTITCQPPTGNTMTIAVPPNGSTVSRPQESGFTPRVNVSGSAWTGASLTIRRPDGTVYRTDTGTPDASPATYYTFPAFNASSVEAGPWTFTFTGAAGSCRSMPLVSTVTIADGTCGVSLSSASWVSTSGSSAFQELDFRVTNDCDFSSITIDGLGVSWSGVTSSSRYVSSINYNSTAYRSSLDATSGAEGAVILFTSPNVVTLTGGATSLTFRFNFNDNMTLSGAHNNNDPGQFDSIVVSISAPTVSTDEAIASAPMSPPFP